MILPPNEELRREGGKQEQWPASRRSDAKDREKNRVREPQDRLWYGCALEEEADARAHIVGEGDEDHTTNMLGHAPTYRRRRARRLQRDILHRQDSRNRGYLGPRLRLHACFHSHPVAAGRSEQFRSEQGDAGGPRRLKRVYFLFPSFSTRIFPGSRSSMNKF
jgi:hypothetical protein